MASSFNYGNLLATSDRLINRFGDLVSVKYFQDAPDPAGDWLPPIRTAQSYDCKAVFTTADEKHADGVYIHVGDQIALLSGKQSRDLTNIIGSLHRGEEVWKFDKIVPVKPGSVILLYKIKVSQ